MRKLNSRNFNERVMHHLFQAMCIANQLQQRYSVPVTEPLDFREAQEFARVLKQAYKGELEAVPLNPHLKEEHHRIRLPEGKQLSQYFPFTLKNAMQGVPQAELPPGHAPPVVICQKTLVVSLLSEKFSGDVDRLIETRSSHLKSLEKSPAEGFRLQVCKDNTKRQGASVSSCILSLIGFLREILVGSSTSHDKQAQNQMQRKGALLAGGQDASTSQIYNDAASQKSSVAGRSDLNAPTMDRQDQTMADTSLKQQEMRQAEIMAIINESLQILKTKRWKEVPQDDKHLVLGLFSVIGGWYGFSRLSAGSQVLVQSNGCWNEATVIDDGAGKRRVSVILDEDASLQLVRVPHSKVKPRQTSIDQGINDKLNFDDLCEAITFLHEQQQQELPKILEAPSSADKSEETLGQSTIEEAMASESVLFQMLLKVCSKLNWSKIDQKSESFNKFRQILIQVTSKSFKLEGQTHEDKTQEYLEKQLIESWERTIDRSEAKNLSFFAPREFLSTAALHVVEDEEKSTDEATSAKDKPAGGSGPFDGFGAGPYVDADYVQPVSSYLHGLPEPVVSRN